MGFSLAASLVMRRITPSLQACGIDPVFQHELYISKRAGGSEGQCFRMLYKMWSRGLGEEDDLDLRMISSISLCEMGSWLNGVIAVGVVVSRLVWCMIWDCCHIPQRSKILLTVGQSKEWWMSPPH